MSRKSIFIILFTMLFSVAIISLYSTFAYDQEAANLNDSTADYNLIYSIKKSSENYILISPNETKYVDVTLENNYDAIVKYGMYYHLISPNNMPEGVTISLAEESPNSLRDIIKSQQQKIITIKVDNKSEYNLELIIGALVGFEKGHLEDLIKDGEILIK